MWPIFQDLLAVFPNLNYVHVGPRLNLLVQADNLDLTFRQRYARNGHIGNNQVLLMSLRILIPADIIILVEYGFQD